MCVRRRDAALKRSLRHWVGGNNVAAGGSTLAKGDSNPLPPFLRLARFILEIAILVIDFIDPGAS